MVSVVEFPEGQKWKNPCIYWDLWWAWVDLNHRPRPYQEGDLRDIFAAIMVTEWIRFPQPSPVRTN